MRALYTMLDRVTEVLGMLFLLSSVAVIFIQVIFRYFLGNALPWPEEAGRYLFLWATYLGISLCMKGDRHLRVTLLPEMLRPAWQKGVNLLCALVNILFFIAVVWLGIEMTGKVHSTGQVAVALPVSIWVIWAGIPLFCLFVLLQAIKNLWLIVHDAL